VFMVLFQFSIVAVFSCQARGNKAFLRDLRESTVANRAHLVYNRQSVQKRAN
jgi:hypothetical protein